MARLKAISDLTWKSKVVKHFNFTGEGKDLEELAGGEMVSEKTHKTVQLLTASGAPKGEQYFKMGKFARGIDKTNV